MDLPILDVACEITVLDRREEFVHLLAVVAHRLHLHATIIQVLHPARHLEAGSNAFNGSAKAHALHAAREEKLSSNHEEEEKRATG